MIVPPFAHTHTHTHTHTRSCSSRSTHFHSRTHFRAFVSIPFSILRICRLCLPSCFWPSLWDDLCRAVARSTRGSRHIVTTVTEERESRRVKGRIYFWRRDRLGTAHRSESRGVKLRFRWDERSRSLIIATARLLLEPSIATFGDYPSNRAQNPPFLIRRSRHAICN